jgi:hypothetical protein
MKKENKMIQRAKPTLSISPVLVDIEKIFQRIEEINQEISNRAFGFFEERGQAFG